MEAKIIFIRVNKEDIQYVTGIFDANARLAVPRTIDRKESILELITSPFYLDDVYTLIEALKKEISIEVLNDYAEKVN